MRSIRKLIGYSLPIVILVWSMKGFGLIWEESRGLFMKEQIAATNDILTFSTEFPKIKKLLFNFLSLPCQLKVLLWLNCSLHWYVSRILQWCQWFNTEYVMFWWFRYQAQLQKNLMYLAAIADAQPQTPTMPPQVTAGMIILLQIFILLRSHLYVHQPLADGPAPCTSTRRILYATPSGSSDGSAAGYFPPKAAIAI